MNMRQWLPGLLSAVAASAYAQPLPNIVFILADNLGYGTKDPYVPEKPE